MTITSTDTRIAYAGDGSSTAFALPWQFFGPDELRVYQVDSDQVETLLERGVHYSVTGGAGSAGTAATGTVVAATAPATGITWVIRRNTTPTQQILLPNAGPMPGPTVERALDRLTAIAQETQASLGRTLRVPAGETDDIPVLPSAADRASKVLTFDVNGDPTAATLDEGTVPISSAMEPVVGAATLATARAAMGARRYVDVVKDFGADNTGNTDTSAALQAAINSLTAGTIYFPPGSYGLAADLLMKPGVAMEADDPLLALLVARANNVRLTKYTASALTNAFSIRRLGFNANGFTGVRAVHLDGTDSAKRISLVTLEDLYIYGCAVGLYLRFCANTRAENVRLNACGNGMYIDQCADTTIYAGWAQNGSDYGIFVTGGPGAYDEGISITAFSTNGQVKGIGVSGQDWGQISNCSLTTCSGGPLAFLNANNWQITGSQFATGGGSPATPGISCDALCTALQITNNIIPLNTFGVNLLGERHVVKGNLFTGNSNIDINLQATKCAVGGNVCHSTGSAVSIQEQAGSDYNNISGNTTNGTVGVVGANSKVNGDNLVY